MLSSVIRSLDHTFVDPFVGSPARTETAAAAVGSSSPALCEITFFNSYYEYSSSILCTVESHSLTAGVKRGRFSIVFAVVLILFLMLSEFRGNLGVLGVLGVPGGLEFIGRILEVPGVLGFVEVVWVL